MVTDLTSCFKECATVYASKKSKETRRASELESEKSEGSQKPPSKTSQTFKNASATARAIAKDLAGLEELLLHKRLDYLSFNSLTCRMTDQERQRFDEQCTKVISQLGQNIRILESRAKQIEIQENMQQGEHLRHVTQLLQSYLSKCTAMMATMRKLRFANEKKKQQTKRLAKLVEHTVAIRKIHQEEAESKPNSLSGSRIHEMKSESGTVKKRKEEEKPKKTADGWDEPEQYQTETSSHLDEPRKSQLMQENAQIYEKFRHIHAEIDHVEEQITEIQRLQETFTEKIFDQEKGIEDLNETAVQITMNIRDGNDWIRQKMPNDSDSDKEMNDLDRFDPENPDPEFEEKEEESGKKSGTRAPFTRTHKLEQAGLFF
ncbi:hypothetical protein WR25_13146 isoform A [Diploscapter pachys]|uniref:SNARE-complex protein Syntaxin-18 N-terminal domain-containing protein n=2 Tax=Diploscapter pachys TaxID=2018661 RepID=A0A2A2LQH5_9BILA|nr:hypothetical protein WR25_13146 isoform A [Diploscapter pachys]